MGMVEAAYGLLCKSRFARSEEDHSGGTVSGFLYQEV
jgi:hypothetical protein